MGLFDSLLSILMPPMGIIHIDYNQKLVNETIEWADELYSRNSLYRVLTQSQTTED